jgi:glycosyl transferase family 87
MRRASTHNCAPMQARAIRLGSFSGLGAADLALFAGLAMGAAALFAFGIVDYRERILSTNDFAGFWAGARLIVLGIDPYDPSVYRSAIAQLGTQHPDVTVFGYPPWMALVLLPFGFLSLPIASGLWTAAGLVAGIYALRALLRAVVPELVMVHWLAGFTLLASQAGLATFFNGQWAFLLLAVSIGIFLLQAEHPRIAGLLAVCAFAKPQLFTFAAWSWLRAAHAQGRLLPFVSIAGGGVILIVVATLIAAPVAFASWWSSVFLWRVSDPTTPTLSAAFADLLGSRGQFAAVGVLVVALVIALRRRPTSLGWWALWPVMSLLGATYTHSYDQLLLLPPLIISTAVVAARSRRRAILYAALWGTLMLPGSMVLQGLAAYRDRENYTVLLTVAVFIAIAVATRKDTTYWGRGVTP